MKEITSLNANFIARVPQDKGEKFIPEIEVALILSEVNYRLGTTGDVHKERTTETVRFVATAENLRKIAKSLIAYADGCETDLSEALHEHADAAVKAEYGRRRVERGVTAKPAQPAPAQDTPPASSPSP